MRRIDYPRSFRHLVQLIDEDRTLLRQVGHYITVVHNLLAHVNRSAKRLQRDLYNIDGTHHPRAEAPWLQKQDAFGGSRGVALGDVRAVKGDCSHAIQYTAYYGPATPMRVPPRMPMFSRHTDGASGSGPGGDTRFWRRRKASTGVIRSIRIRPRPPPSTRTNITPCHRIHDDRNGRSAWSYPSHPRNVGNKISCPQGPYTYKPYDRIWWVCLASILLEVVQFRSSGFAKHSTRCLRFLARTLSSHQTPGAPFIAASSR